MSAGAVVAQTRLRLAVNRYRAAPHPQALEGAFAAAAVLLHMMRAPDQPPGRPDLEWVRGLTRSLPELDELLSLAAGEAGRSLHAGTTVLWRTLGLQSPAPGWTDAEVQTARLVIACACAAGPGSVVGTETETGAGTVAAGDRLGASLRMLAARRLAARLCDELAADEEALIRALADRYASVRHRCAPRTAWRSRGLAELLRDDDGVRGAVTGALERWIAGGGRLPALAAQLEAAIVHARTPARLA
jgi:hypothetical protein